MMAAMCLPAQAGDTSLGGKASDMEILVYASGVMDASSLGPVSIGTIAPNGTLTTYSAVNIPGVHAYLHGSVLRLQLYLDSYGDETVSGIGYHLWSLSQIGNKITDRYPGRFRYIEECVINATGIIRATANITIAQH
jgi:hypothetical protein